MTGDLTAYGLPLNYQYTYSGDGSKSDYQMLIPASVYKDNATRTETYGFEGNKQESNPSITYNKTASLNDYSSGTIYTHFNTATDEDPGDDTPVTPDYEKSAEIPYDSSINYQYSSNWTVPHDTGSGTKGAAGTTSAGKEMTITSIVTWDGLFPGSNVYGTRNQIRGDVYTCLHANHPFIINDWGNGGGCCDYSVTTSTVSGY
jgi:hypothetical protein